MENRNRTICIKFRVGNKHLEGHNKKYFTRSSSQPVQVHNQVPKSAQRTERITKRYFKQNRKQIFRSTRFEKRHAIVDYFYASSLQPPYEKLLKIRYK